MKPTIIARLRRVLLVVAVIIMWHAAGAVNTFSVDLALLNDSTLTHRMARTAIAEPDSLEAQTAQVVDTTGIASEWPDSLYAALPVGERVAIEGDSILTEGDSIIVKPEGVIAVDSCATCGPDYDSDYVVRDFHPDPTRAVWLSALCPGLGQLYNRRYWKLPIVVGGFMGLIYGYSWNNQMLTDYTQAYRDLMDNDPSTKSYMDFYPPGTDESKLNKTWLQKLFKSRKDFFRRNRDLCVIGMIGVYMVAMVDAYVDASLTHFDVSPDLSVDLYPQLVPSPGSSRPGVALAWAFTF